MNKAFSTRAYFTATLAVTLVAVILMYGLSPQKAQEKASEPDHKGAYEKYAKPDGVSADIRSGKTDLVRVSFKKYEEREAVKAFGDVVQDLGSAAIVSTKKAAEMTRAGFAVQKLETTVNLPGKSFDPIIDPPAGTIGQEYESGSGYFVVQFGAATTDDLLNSLRDAGVEVLQYVPHQAFFVYGNGEAIGKVAAHSRVRWLGRYLPEHKLTREVSDLGRNQKGETLMFDIAYFSRADLSLAAQTFRSRSSGRIIAEQRIASNYFNVLRVEMPASEIAAVSELPDVFSIDTYVRATIEDERAAQIISGNFSSPTVLSSPGYDPLTQFGADGTGVTVMVSDDGISIPGNGGFYVTTNNTVHGPLRGGTSTASGGHGHINASIIAGSTPFGILDPTGYNYGRGIAPNANIINIPFLQGTNTTTDVQAIDDSLNTLGPNGVRGTISNNSWGAGLNGNSYSTREATYDALARDGSIASSIDPFTIIFSAGNSGTSGMTRPKMSKNSISVANSENVRAELGGTGADNMEDLRSSSSRGPAADGRIKPDITAPGTVITGSRAGTCSSVTSCFDANHAYSSGTSHAAPQVAGAAALFTQYWKERNAGQEPRPSLIKASVISSGQEMNGLTTNLLTIPNGNEGWGRLNMRLMMNTGVPMKHVNETHAFSNPAESVVYTGTVADATKPFRVSFVWSDPPGVSNPALVNDLDLTVTVGANTYRGNVFSGGVSVTGGTNSTIDNVENVFLGAGIPAGTPVTITINATALNGDGILGNADATDQHFSLVAYNFQESTAVSAAPFDFTGDGRTDLAIFRPSAGQWWFSSTEPDGTSGAVQFGASTDVIVPADFTGDSTADFAVWRPSTGEWLILRSEDFSFYSFPFGASEDIPTPDDFDADGKADVAVFRPSTGTWYILNSGSGGVDFVGFGQMGDVPAVGDYDGDGRADIAIYRPSSGQWWINNSTAGVSAVQFGSSADMVVQGDYTGDGLTDIAFWRPTTGDWFVLRSEDLSFFSVPFGQSTDIPVPGDYDGDGQYDIAMFRPSANTWFLQRSTAGILIATFGSAGDRPVPSAFVR